MSVIKNPWEMGEEVSNGATIPAFIEGKFMLIRLVPPKGKTIRDGLVTTLALISYRDDKDQEIKMVEVDQTTNGYTVTFPLGKRGIMATKFRGPKSFYKFKNNVTEKWYQIGKNDPKTFVNSKLTLEYAQEYLAQNIKDWETFSDIEKDQQIDEYYEDLYMFGLAKDFNLNIESKEDEVPSVGMVTSFYRRYTPPKEGERYGNVIVTKFAPREGKETLSGENTTVDTEIAANIYESLTARDEQASTFDPTEFEEKSVEEEII